MKVTVFGASGKVGRQVVSLALERGHRVTAFVHEHNPFEDASNLHVITGDIRDKAAVVGALRDREAVISALGSWHRPDKSVLTQGMQTILPAMQAAGIRRIVTLTGANAFWEEDTPSAVDRLGHSILNTLASGILHDSEEHLRLLAASGLDWTCVRSPLMTRSHNHRYHLKRQLPSLLATIPREAVAHCLVDQLENVDFLRQAPIIYP